MTDAAYVWGTGRRKCAVAQVRLYAGEGGILVNGKPHTELFPRLEHRRMIEGPLTVTDMMGKFRVEVKVLGGGTTGQAGAISHGIARALVRESEVLKPALRKEGFLTRDPRVKERKKYGLRRARKAPQYTKR
ncbi:MAG: 30S ribosomal protein S9 [Dehalococcoidia bacterium]|nr:30S ribosomal protein S9 [Dehalococcoidia bacterium]